MTAPALLRLVAAAASYIEAVRLQDAAEHLHRIRMLSRAPDSVVSAAQAEWNAAAVAARNAYAELARVSAEAQQAIAAAATPHPDAPRLPLAVEMAQYARQAELRRRFEQERG